MTLRGKCRRRDLRSAGGAAAPAARTIAAMAAVDRDALYSGTSSPGSRPGRRRSTAGRPGTRTGQRVPAPERARERRSRSLPRPPARREEADTYLHSARPEFARANTGREPEGGRFAAAALVINPRLEIVCGGDVRVLVHACRLGPREPSRVREPFSRSSSERSSASRIPRRSRPDRADRRRPPRLHRPPGSRRRSPLRPGSPTPLLRAAASRIPRTGSERRAPPLAGRGRRARH